MLNDISYAFRTLRKSPIFTITVVVTIALAIGASTAIFSVTNGVLLRKLPYKDPERLVLAANDLQKRNVKDFPMSNADFLDLRNGAKSNFDDFAAVQSFRLTLPGLDGTPERVRVAAVSTNFFQMMGGSIVAGRDFQDSDGTPQPQPPAAPAGNALPLTNRPRYRRWRSSATNTSNSALAAIVRSLANRFQCLPRLDHRQRSSVCWLPDLNYCFHRKRTRNSFRVSGLQPAFLTTLPAATTCSGARLDG